jgi:predicted DNA-binding transcriptional regulator AlpA
MLEKDDVDSTEVDFNKRQLVSRLEASKFLKISLTKMAYLTNPNHAYYDHDFPKPIHIGKSVRFDTAELLAYIASKK